MYWVIIIFAIAFIIILLKKIDINIQTSDLIINDALLSNEELIQHARDIANEHLKCKRKKSSSQLFKRLDENFKFITKTYLYLNENSKMGLPLCPGSDWLLDNFYVIEEQYKNLKQNSNAKFFNKINILKSGRHKNYPRVFLLAVELISHTDGRLDKNQLVDFITSYQSISPLSMAELWSLSFMIKIALIENIRHTCEKILFVQNQWVKAEKLKDMDHSSIIKSIRKNTEEITPSLFPYIEHALRVLRKNDINLYTIFNHFNTKLSNLDLDVESVIKREHQEQSSYQITMGNCISSLRLSNVLDWKEIFESLSLVEKILRKDPIGVYSKQDFESRNYYRKALEKIAHDIKKSETTVAKKVLELANSSKESQKSLKECHVGYYIIGKGKKYLFEELGKSKVINLSYAFKFAFTFILTTLLASFLPACYVYQRQGILMSIFCFIIFIIPATQIALDLSNYIFSNTIFPKLLPKLDLKDGIPEDCSTLVIVPTILPDENRTIELIKNLEITYAANGQENIYFAIVGDLKDSNKEIEDTDKNIIQTALEKISELNKKYSKGKDIFYVFIRKRTFNSSERKWIGYERKRGAILELNNLIKGSNDTTYSIISGSIENLKDIKYIITLDADTIMPIGCASRLIGTISHPLNMAEYDENKNIVTEGYGIIQPRIGINIDVTIKSIFNCIFASNAGIDPYSSAMSDLYQNIFNEGIFTGKGIYDIDIYRKCLNDAIPDNTVLSHDLLEGSYLRCGLATDIELIDSFPEKYSSYIMRLHRWTRGDWQIIQWLSKKIKNRKGEIIKNPLSSLSKLKILDNMRRSLVPLFLMLIILLGSTIFPGDLIFYIGYSLFIVFFTLFTFILGYINYGHYKGSRKRINGNIIYGIKSILYEDILMFIFLPYHAFILCDAIIKAQYRLFISKHKLLEWITAADAEKKSRNDLKGYYKNMSSQIIISLIFLSIVSIFKPSDIILSALLSFIWLIAPYVAYYISKPIISKKYELSNEDKEILIRIAKKTFDFYENFTTESDNYLPPDNYQETPVKRIAHRTSPTNIGFYLISMLCSYDLGFITLNELIQRIDRTITTIERLEKWNGHLYNWYDTRTLEVLRPKYISTVDSGNFIGYLIVLKQFFESITNSNEIASSLIKRIDYIIDNTKFLPLYDEKRNLFSIGYNVEEDHLTNSYYDLLASEARLISYIAVSRREVPVSHWFKLGRSLTLIDRYESLVSWTGTMFEYLMPALVMKYYDNTLLSETYKTSIKAQIKYGNRRGVPWGTSESGFYTFDLALNYQYKAFGVPDLGLKRGLSSDMVISPYSTILALPFSPKEAILNLKKLIEKGIEGKYGLYEAIDYTPDRLPFNKNHAIVESYMAHHQGMILVSLNNFLNDNIIIKRFHSSPFMKAGEFLLQEKIPVRAIITKEHKETIKPFEKVEGIEVTTASHYGYNTIIPKCHMLSNGYYTLMINNSGSGFSKAQDINISRWREDTVSRGYGQFFFIRDLESNYIWSGTFEPLNVKPDRYDSKFSQDKAEFIRLDGDIETHIEICVSPEDNCEIRKITLRNVSNSIRSIEITSYLEVVLSHQAADVAHPAFNNLFIRTEWVEENKTLLASRRQREINKNTLWAFHTLTAHCESVTNIEYETDRYKFIGRNRYIANAHALNHPLTNTIGPVLDPIMSLRCRVTIEPNKSITVSYITGYADNKEIALELSQKYSQVSNIERTFELAYVRSLMETKYLNLKESDIKLYNNLMSHIIYLSPIRQKYSDIIKNNVKGQSGLWAYGISGDLPIVLTTIKKADDIEIVKEMLKAFEYWRTRGLKVDLVILNEDEGSYLEPLQNLLRDLVFSGSFRSFIDCTGGIFIRSASNMPKEDITLLYSVARIVIKAELGNILNQVDLSWYNIPKSKPINKIKNTEIEYLNGDDNLNLKFFNGYGGFDEDKKEYVIKLKKDLSTPAPWINVISNKNFGFIISESGGGYTWAENSRENKITPWSNDPVCDTLGEIIYIRDDETGEFWTITPSPIREKEPYYVYHGFGYSRFNHYSHGIDGLLTLFVPLNDNIKICYLNLKNKSNSNRKLSIFHYLRPVMGVSEHISEQFISTKFNKDFNALLFTNSYNTDHPNRVCFISSSIDAKSYTTDRMEFLGPYGNIYSPKALEYSTLSNTTGCGFNTCCVLHYVLDIPSCSEKELVLLIGESTNESSALSLCKDYKNISNCKESLKKVILFWEDILGTIKVDTPDESMNIMLNHYLLYQTISCRLWARSAFYQSGGAYGFRDQLQDTLCILYSMPDVAKKQILLHAAHQFVEGDVLHWWHSGAYDRGIRTKFSDDLVWLAYITAEYIEKTGDYDILNEIVGYVEDVPLKEDEDEKYIIPRISDEKSTIYEHCIRAIDRALKFGPNGIPLMGSGDWNDGMNAVGRKGRGESIWLGFFLYDTLKKFIPLCKYMKDEEKAAYYEEISKHIVSSIEKNAWDGQWYKRAYFDDGTPLGSSVNSECKIDSIAQSWAIISDAAQFDRAQRAIKSVYDYLVKEEDGLILLFTPPFDKGELNPGYIRGYVPGVRENGGQYTHASTWVIYAYAKLGDGDMAHHLFNLINPLNHTRTQMECNKYKVEPYVVAADVYASKPHIGRGGWTWYTGSSSWMYKVGLEKILGFEKKGDILYINPCIPSDWKEFSIRYKYKNTFYNIKVQNPNGLNTGVQSISMDGISTKDNRIPLIDDRSEHNINIIMGHL
ncbi:glycosyl transferase family 36 [Caloramator sp. E03]|uniref:GH36-type glycosyl hydrolase domain-containing protein n=1 Tax=Caloramator sp. E03 TaxID=2576307 RepID=UPI001110F364|nr:glucoamylase family protein [Caloramator sp. E03]QCX34529.1 glycosyl transferase family 36 [Caloramator sp. E03]